MGKPRDDQMQGTPAEQLSELAGRVCYDSLGKGRPSFSRVHANYSGMNHLGGPRHGDHIEGYHDHILNVGHGSVLEHFNFTIEIDKFDDQSEVCAMDLGYSLLNRPGIFACCLSIDRIRITANLRSVLDFDRFSFDAEHGGGQAWEIGSALATAANQLAPNVIKLPAKQTPLPWRLVEASEDEERWVSLFLSGSRGFSHEQVRHKFRTAVSQRSTRYVDESESPWVEHPLIEDFIGDASETSIPFGRDCVIDSAQRAYSATVLELESALTDRGVDKASARKQARGAARGYLGNPLYTEMIFSASTAQWRRMLVQRCSDAADAEIRLIYNQVLGELKSCRHGDRFADMTLRPASDGIGMVLA